MLKFSKRVEYGLTALLHLAQQPRGCLVPSHQLSELYHIPAEHLGKVLQKMVKGGLLESVQGAHGGYALIKRLSDISLGDVVETLDGPLAPERAPMEEGHDACEKVCTCYTHGVLGVSRQLIRNRMFEFNLEQMLDLTGLRSAASVAAGEHA
jgi:Rrf2 family protein